MPKKPALKDSSIQKMIAYPKLEFITTGVKSLDEICNGFPVGRITEIYGKKSVGKTTLTMMMAAEVSKTSKILIIDAENALNVDRMAELGANFDNIDFSTISSLEEIGKLILNNIQNYRCIVLDSIASTITDTETSSQVGDHNVGNKGKVLNSIFNRRLPERLAKTKCALVLINQLRDSFNMYGDKTYTPGGRAIEYAASLRVELNTLASDRIIEDSVQTGHWITAKLTKSKVSQPYRTARFKILY